MSTALFNGYSQATAPKAMITPAQKTRIQELLSKMFNAISPRNEVDSPVYAWFPEGDSTGEMEPVDVEPDYEQPVPAAEYIVEYAGEADEIIDEPVAPAPAPIVENVISFAPLRNFKNVIREIAGTSENAVIDRIPVKHAITGDIVALKDPFEQEPRTGLVIADNCGQLIVHSRDARGWSRVPLQIYQNDGEILAAYRIH